MLLVLIHLEDENQAGLRTELHSVAHIQLNACLPDTLVGQGNHETSCENII